MPASRATAASRRVNLHAASLRYLTEISRLGSIRRASVALNVAASAVNRQVLRLERDFWLLEDSGSTNGTFIGPERVRKVPITGECLVRLGHPQDHPAHIVQSE